MDFSFLPFEPPDTLKPFVRQTFFARGRIPYRSDKILPNGLVVLIFNLGAPHRLGKSQEPELNEPFPHNWLSGVQTTPLYNTPGAETIVVGILFEPIGFHALFGLDMRGLVDRTLDARERLTTQFIADCELLLPQAHTKAGHDSLNRILADISRRDVPDWLQFLYGKIRHSVGAVTLSEVYDEIGLSPRHISESFKNVVGVSPKVLCRIYRLEALLRRIDPRQPETWAALAHEFGFADQAHFNKEFQKFAGLQPSIYLEQRQRDLPELAQGESVHFAPQR